MIYPLVSKLSKQSDNIFFSWLANFADGIHDLIGYYITQDHKGFDEDGDHFALWMIEVIIWSARIFFTGASRRLEPVIKCCLFLSFFQSLVSRAPLSAVEDIPDKDYNFGLGNDNFHNLYERLLHERKLKSGYLERRIYERPLLLRVNLLSRIKANIFQNYVYINSCKT